MNFKLYLITMAAMSIFALIGNARDPKKNKADRFFSTIMTGWTVLVLIDYLRGGLS